MLNEILILTDVDPSSGSERYLYVPPVLPRDRFVKAVYLTQTPIADPEKTAVISQIRSRARMSVPELDDNEFEIRLREDAILF